MNFKPNPLLYGAHEDFFSSFKLVAVMRDEVDHARLVDAVNSAIKRYPYFSVLAEKIGESLELKFNSAPVPVFKDSRCVTLGGEDCNGHLIAFGCEGRRIILHVSHFIADGMGISPLLMSVLYLYASAKYGTDGLCAKRILMPDDPISDAEYRYPFPEATARADGAEAKAKTDAYALDSTAFDTRGLYAYHLHIPQGAMMKVAGSSDGSPASFLSVMLFRALCALDGELDKSVIAHVQHQYRAAINAPLNRHSLVSYIPVNLSPVIKERSVELQNTVIRGQIILGSEPEADLCAIDRLASVFCDSKCSTLKEKQLAMRRYIESSISPKTFGISYVGKMDWCGLDRYVEDLHVYIGEKDTPNMLLIEVMTVGENFSVNFMQSGKGSRYVDAFIEEIKKAGIPINLAGEERYTLCNTKIPQ